jgi:1-acyl-sn-glycerol-3-phosphate acyltransferase
MASPYRILGWTLLPLLRWRIDRIDGLEHLPTNRGYILCPNHQSWVDSGILAAAIFQRLRKPLKYISQTSKYRFLGAIPIQEYDRTETLEIAEGYLRAGHPVVVFPEGNSNGGANLRPPRTGAARLALRTGLPVIPVGIRGTRGIKFWATLGWLISFWKSCQIVIGPPQTWPRTVLTGEDEALLQRVSSEIMSEISRLSGKPLSVSAVPPPYRPMVGWQRWIMRMLRLLMTPRVRIENPEHLPTHGPYIVVANHQSYLDPATAHVAIWKLRGVVPFFLTKASVVAVWQKLFGRGIVDALGMLPLDQAEPSRVLHRAEAHLRRRGVVGIFPEGTRNKPKLNPDWRKTMLKARTGAARLYLATRVPVIPAGIRVPAGWGFWATLREAVLPRRTYIRFGPPVEFTRVPDGPPTKADLEHLSREMMLRISELCGKAYPY